MRRHEVLLVLTALAAGTPLAGQEAAPARSGGHDDAPIARAVRTEAPITIDGRLDEAAWADAPPITGFTQVDPEEGRPVSERTEARILYDDAALYVGVRLYDDGRIIGRLGRRDMSLGDSDWLGVVLDSYHDHRTAFSFDVNPAGVQRDAVKTTASGGGAAESDDNSWDPVWRGETSVTEGEGWVAEYRIPFSQLRFSGEAVQTWGIQIERVIGRKREYAVFSFTPKDERGGIARYGHLVGLRDIEPGNRLELLPYTVARGEYVDPAGNPFRESAEHGVSAGLDLLFRPTTNLTLNATVNPDFGQVEVDPAVVNLGVYETFFEEKRPFFIEGGEIFDFNSGGGGQLFYSRRIGRRPQISTPTSAADLPDATTIVSAAKLSGKTAGGWSIGVLDATTAKETARYRADDGTDHDYVVEPLTNYFVGRARREIDAGRTSIGAILTATNRRLSSEPARTLLLSGAYAGGIDFRHEWADRSWALTGSLSGTLVTGGASALTRVQTASNHYFQRPDAEHLAVDPGATSLAGLAGYLSLSKQAGEHWRGGVSIGTTTPGFEANDLGFSYRTDRRDFQADVRYVENDPGDFLRNWFVGGSARFEGNYDNQLIANWMMLSAFARTLDFWSVHTLVRYSIRANDDRLTRGGPIAARPAQLFGLLSLSSDPRRPLTLRGTVAALRDEFGGNAIQGVPSIGLNVSSRWDLSIGPRIVRSHDVAQYVTRIPDAAAAATFGDRYVFAPLDRTEVGLETRFNLTFTPKLSLQAYLQPLLSSGDYGAPEELAEPGTHRFDPYGGAEPIPDLDFNLRSLRGNAVLRWEWRPGSTLYVAWQQSRRHVASGVGDFDLGRDADVLFATDADDILVVKVDYWFSP